MSPRISVIISVYNGQKYLEESIKSILDQKYDNFEFIIVNDKSTDNSLEIIKSFDDPRIILIDNKENLGLTRSLNNALKVAQGEYIARQDDDDISLPKRLKEQLNFMEENPEIVLSGTFIYRIDNAGKIIDEVHNMVNPSYQDMLKHNHIKHGSVMFKKDVICELGGYNELFRYVQDYELWIRVSRDYKISNLNKPLYKLRIHSESIGSNKIEESRLYSVLARKINQKDLNPLVIQEIYNNGIKSLYNYLSENELLEIKKEIHIIKAGNYIQQENLKMARSEYKKIFKLDHHDFKSLINIVRSYFGIRVYNITSSFFNQLSK